jgi:uncharacterized protein
MMMNDNKEIIKFEDLFKEEIKERKMNKKPADKRNYGYAIVFYLLIMYVFASLVFIIASDVDALHVTYNEDERVLESVLSSEHALTFMKPETYALYENEYQRYLKIIDTQGIYNDYLIIVNKLNPYYESFFFILDDVSEVLVFNSTRITELTNPQFGELYWDEDDSAIVIYKGASQDFPSTNNSLLVRTLDGPVTQFSSFGMALVNIIIYLALFPGVLYILRKEVNIDLDELKEKKNTIFPAVAIGYALVIVGNVIANFISKELSNAFGILPSESVNQQIIVQALRSDGVLLIFLSAVILGPVVEELIFRKAIFGLIKNNSVALAVSSFIFGAIHLVGEASIGEALVNGVAYFMMGIVFGYIYLRNNRNIWIPTLVHILSNLISVLAILFLL